MKPTILLLSVASLFFSCSNGDLSRKNAKKQIIKHYQYPSIELSYVNYESIGRHSRIPDGYMELVAEGYLTYINKQYALKFKRTAKSEPYFLEYKNPSYKFAGNTLDFGKITGIKLNDASNRATVFYTTVRNDITPFGTFAKRREGETVENKATFEKYDDGWRISDKTKEMITPQTFKYLDENLKLDPKIKIELDFLGNWYSLENGTFGCKDVIEIVKNEDNGFGLSVNMFPLCEQEYGGSGFGGKIVNDKLIFEGNDHFGGLKLQIKDGYLIDLEDKENTKYTKTK